MTSSLRHWRNFWPNVHHASSKPECSANKNIFFYFSKIANFRFLFAEHSGLELAWGTLGLKFLQWWRELLKIYHLTCLFYFSEKFESGKNYSHLFCKPFYSKCFSLITINSHIYSETLKNITKMSTFSDTKLFDDSQIILQISVRLVNTTITTYFTNPDIHDQNPSWYFHCFK